MRSLEFPTLLIAVGLATGCGARDARLLDPPLRCAEELGGSEGELAKSADELVAFSGVGVRINYPLAAYENLDVIRQRLAELGARHIADDDLTVNSRAADVSSLGAAVVAFQNETPETLLAAAANPGVDALQLRVVPEAEAAVSFVADNLENVQQVRKLLDTSGLSGRLDLVGPRLPPELGNQLDLSTLVDLRNVNVFPGTLDPEAFDLDARMAEDDPAYGSVAPVAIQLGYATGSSDQSVSEVVQAKYQLRLLLRLFGSGFRRAYHAQIADWEEDGPFSESLGLLRWDTTPKPLFSTLVNFNSIVADREAELAPGRLRFELQASNPALRYVLVQKANRSFLLIVWLGVPSVDADVTAPIALQFSTRVAEVAVYDPSISSAPFERFSSPTTLELEVPDHPLILALLPECALH